MKLREYFDKYQVNRTAFAKEHDITISQVFRIQEGNPITLFTAAKLVQCTDGEVSFEDLLTEKEKMHLGL